MRRMARNCEGSKGVLSRFSHFLLRSLQAHLSQLPAAPTRGEVDVLFNKALAMAEGHDFKVDRIGKSEGSRAMAGMHNVGLQLYGVVPAR